MAHQIVELALESIRHYLETGRTLSPGMPEGELARKAGVFVSLRKGGALRGCIGTYRPSRDNIAEETVHNAISAATADPRFPAVTPEELPELECSVDVLSEPEPVSGPGELDPETYGVIVESGWKRGLLLPRLEGIGTAGEQVEIARQKAGIHPGAPVNLYRFRVERYH